MGQRDAAASAIGFFRLPAGRGERRGKHFGRFSLAVVSLGTGQTDGDPGSGPG